MDTWWYIEQEIAKLSKSTIVTIGILNTIITKAKLKESQDRENLENSFEMHH